MVGEGGATTLYFVRHADVHNPGDVLYGRLPRFGLSDLGREQAERTAAVLAEEPVGAFYTSPQLRARQTARMLAASHPDQAIHISRLLNEVRTAWQGSPNSELEPFHFDFYTRPLHESDETLETLWERTGRFIRRVRRRHAGEAVVAVTHGDIVFLVREVFQGKPVVPQSIRMPDFYPGKASLTRLAFGPDLAQLRPLKVAYYDPNSPDPRWSGGWVELTTDDRRWK